MAKYTFKAERKRKYHRESRMSKAEIMVIMILFHSSGYRCLKHFYLEKVCKHMRHLFPEVVSYNRWSSESRSQTCLDYAESRQRKMIVNRFVEPEREMSVSDKLLLRKRAIIETVNDELKNIAQVEHSRHRSFGNFVVNLLGGIAAYCYFPKKPSIRVQTVDISNDRQFTLF